MLTYLFIYLGRSAYGRNECRRMVVVRWNCSQIVVVMKEVLDAWRSDANKGG